MKIGFYLQWNKGSLSGPGNVLGDELLGEAMCRVLRRLYPGLRCEVYAPNFLPEDKLDVMVYFNNTLPTFKWARRHVVYIQNARPEGSDKFLAICRTSGFDGYAFISHRLYEMHVSGGFRGIYLPFGVDTSFFFPRPDNSAYRFEVSYVGSDIKGEARAVKYLCPALKFDFGLYGNWALPHRFKFWRNRPYQRKLARIARGKIPQEEVPSLYSNSLINLNYTAQDCVDWDVITMRTFEVLSCRGFLISDKVPLAEKELKDCVVFTDGDEDMSDKIRYYLAHPKERKRIAENGYEYAVSHASLDSRMKVLCEYLEGIL